MADAQGAFAEPPPSPMKNALGGSGCGCGCLGALVAFVGAILLAGIPLAFYDGEPTWVWWAGGGSIAAGLLVGLLGLGMWAASMFMD